MTPSQHAPVLLFDVMDTLVRDPFHTVVPEFFGMTLERFLREKHPSAWIEFERGNMTRDEYYASLFRDGRRFDHRLLEQTLRDAYVWLDGMLDLVEDLSRAGVEMHALSNYPDWYRIIDDKLALSRYVSWTFVSCKTKVRKPEPRAFTGAAAALGRPVNTCLFVDDRPANCAAAERLDMPAIVFSSATSLRAELVRRDLLSG